MKNIYFYFHAGSKNHGCEAIVRSTCKILGVKPALVSFAEEDDKLYGIDRIADIRARKVAPYSLLDKVKSVIGERLLKTEKYSYDVASKNECKFFEGPGIAMSIGGDNYCYGTAYDHHLAGMNRRLHHRGLKTVLWGCSVEPSRTTPDMVKDFSRYDLIVTRETISYEHLKKYNENTVLACDPAFLLDKEDVPLPDGFVSGKTVGINISPMIQNNESIAGITMENYRGMIRWIIENTDQQIALIPHVVLESNDDRVPLRKLYDEFAETGRVVMIDDCNCMQLKGYISQCSMFVGARTHATIAAYSTGVPTLVIGYSTKAMGIARDLFGCEDNYVLPVQNLKTSEDMTEAFKWLCDNRRAVKEKLDAVMPEYKASMDKIKEELEKLR